MLILCLSYFITIVMQLLPLTNLITYLLKVKGTKNPSSQRHHSRRTEIPCRKRNLMLLPGPMEQEEKWGQLPPSPHCPHCSSCSTGPGRSIRFRLLLILDILAKPDPSNDLPPIIAHPLRFLEFPPSLFFSSSSTWNKKKHQFNHPTNVTSANLVIEFTYSIQNI